VQGILAIASLGLAWLATLATHVLCNVGPLDRRQLGASAASFGVHSIAEVHTMPGWIGSQLGDPDQDLNMVISGPAGFSKAWFLNEQVVPALHKRWGPAPANVCWTTNNAGHSLAICDGLWLFIAAAFPVWCRALC